MKRLLPNIERYSVEGECNCDYHIMSRYIIEKYGHDVAEEWAHEMTYAESLFLDTNDRYELDRCFNVNHVNRWARSL